MVITGQVPTTALGTDAFQESDITGITLPIVKHSYLLKRAEDIAPTIAAAYHIAQTGRPGPVLIDIPSNLAQAKNVVYNFPDEVKLESYKPTVKGNTKQVKQAVRAPKAAKRPVLYVGGGVLASHACKELLFIAETLQVPTVVSLTAKGVFPEDNPLCLGLAGLRGSRAANMALSESDLIFCAGARFADRLSGESGSFAPSAKAVHVDIDPAEIGKNRNADIPIVGDARMVLAAVGEELAKDIPEPKTGRWLAQIEAWRAESPLYYEQREGAVSPEAVMELLNGMTKGREPFT